MIKQNQSKAFIPEKAKIKSCSATRETIVFSYSHVCSSDEYNFNCFKSKKKTALMAESVAALHNKFSEMSKMTWDDFFSKPRKSGMEYIPVSEFKSTFINSINYKLTDDDKLIVVRFCAQDYRVILKRGSKCGRVAQVLGIDLDLDLYEH